MINLNRVELLYSELQHKLKGKEGKIIAIDVESGDYFLGNNTLEAFEQGRKKYPHKEFFFKRIGARTAFVVGKV